MLPHSLILANGTKLKAQSHTGRVVTGRGRQNERTMKEKHHTGRVESKMKAKSKQKESKMKAK